MRAAPMRRTAPVPPEHAVLALVKELARAEAKAAKLEAQLRRIHAEKRKPDVKNQDSTTSNHARTTRESPKDDPAAVNNGKDLHATLRDALIQLKVYRKHVQLLQSDRQQLLAQWPHLAANMPSNVATAPRAASPDAGPRSVPPSHDAGMDPIVNANPPSPPEVVPPARARSPSPVQDPERFRYHDALALDTSWANREALLPGIGAACAPGDDHESPGPFTHAHAPEMHSPAPPAPPVAIAFVAPDFPASTPASAADADTPTHGASLITVPAGESLLAIDLTLPLAPPASAPVTAARHRAASDELAACEPTVTVIREFESTRGMTRNVRRLLAHTRGSGQSGSRPESPRTTSPSTKASVSLSDAGWPILGAVNAEIPDDRCRRSPSAQCAPDAPPMRQSESLPATSAHHAAEAAMAGSSPAEPASWTSHGLAPRSRTPRRPALVDKSVATDVRATRASSTDPSHSRHDRRHDSRWPPRPASRDTTRVSAVPGDPAPAIAASTDLWDADLDEITALLNGMPLDRTRAAAATVPWDRHGRHADTVVTGRATGAHRRTSRHLRPLLPGADEDSLASLSALIDHLELADSGNVPSRM
ncbi:hypothetical protein AMAG_01610 [Allomyces macrogynus ATCC 38327]|uniref:Uncharacterized protein n=1 Tax=Allomyces macrogynus (strain ATCC 38327) TaxID=578462 RepID=A0A0L0RZG9_ALLM3|nr:hypothetical protein AMAG_01610 [Allomyces macrogynus ATCC 38327]|eukprot:KNE55733.1 hypothetical protein AMAG_01610 [Allomyces macrogynus ATCC 38327]